VNDAGRAQPLPSRASIAGKRGHGLEILIVTQYYWPESFRITDLALGLKERGHRVTVLTGMPNYPGGRLFPGYGPLGPMTETHEEIEVKRVPLVPRFSGRGWQLALNYLSFALSASVLGPLRCRGRFDLIFVFEPSPVTVALPAIVLKALTGAPVLFWVQDLWPESLQATEAVKSPTVLRWVERLVRFIYRRCDRILVQSEGFVPRVAALDAEPARIVYFPNWAEPVYRPVAVPHDAPERGELPRGFRVMFAGNIGAAQSFETILAAAERLRGHEEIQWIILGDGHQRPWVAQEIERRGLNGCVRLLGRHPVETMPTYFALADALLVTLRDDPVFALTIPSKIQSYQACGRPILAALNGEGARVVHESGCGLACPAGDSEGLARAVLTLRRMSPEERERMGARGRTYFNANFERSRLLDKLESWMQIDAGRRACAS
jgi:glycosyltransferase involved in cell wall biosynthesis